MKKIILIFAVFAYLSTAKIVNAIVDPLAVNNNKYGIHIIDENDLATASDLVNSTGDWGYITMVITDYDRSVEKWQRIFDRMRNLHLIPIIRIATHPIGDSWAKPKIEDAKSWADFLGNLYWVTKNRYIILFNEPNHSAEWGKSLNPTEYAQILKIYSINLKQNSTDFFILPAGLDASAPNSSSTMDEVDFLREMVFSQPDILSHIDGWTSHSYPNPGFSGKVTDSGRGTLRTYLWELEILKSFGLKTPLPVFITETGWAHQEGLVSNKSYYSADIIANFIQKAAQNIWNDRQIVAITPFILNYQSYPFANFSWQKPNENTFYPFFDTYKALAKMSGNPVLNRVFEDVGTFALKNLNSNSTAEINTYQPKINKKILASLFYKVFKL